MQEAALTVQVPTDLAGVFNVLAGQLADSSIAMYRRDFNAYITFAQNNNHSPVDATTLMLWRDSLVRTSDMSPNTINRMLSSVKRVIYEASVRALLSKDIMRDFREVKGVTRKALKDRMKHTQSIPISREQMQTLCNLPDDSTLLGVRDKALLFTLATTGLRAGELASLLVSRVFKVDRGYIIQVMGKTDEEYRDITLPPVTYKLIQHWLAKRGVQSPYVFTGFNEYGRVPHDGKLSAKAIWDVVKQYAKQAGLDYISPHSFRRFVGTQLAKGDARIAQQVLGHKDINTTIKYYVLDKTPMGVTDDLVTLVE